jgi:Na+-transporting methylmalonyl-CoA/oxaloacetate decarboxylase gamma subunit
MLGSSRLTLSDAQGAWLSYIGSALVFAFLLYLIALI